MTVFEPRYYFFSGKGGVGKTSLSAATAVHFAGLGKRTLILTTDPASNLADVFEQEIGHKVTAISGIDNLWAMELDPDKATAEYKERTLAPLKSILPETMLKIMEEQLDSPCTSEMATFERFVGFLQKNDFDIIVFDTAPTGHTLRLLELPADWSRVIEIGAEKGIDTCIGPAQALADSKAAFDEALSALKDTEQTRFMFVLRPDTASIKETQRSIKELAKLGINSTELVVNGLFPPEVCESAFFRAKFNGQIDRLKNIVGFKPEAKALFLQSKEIKGIDSLKTIAKNLYDAPLTATALISQARDIFSNLEPTGEDVQPKGDSSVFKLGPLDEKNETHLIFFTGKGGVGKTVLSCVSAIGLADQGHRTLLVTTDPAAHLAQVLGEHVDKEARQILSVKNLWVTRIDPKAEAEAYKTRILADAKDKYSDDRLAVMKEELDSPCTEEMAVFYKFVDLVACNDYDFMVFDTAPTGHTLRLLRLPIEWSKQLEIKTFSTKELSEADAAAKSSFDTVIKRLRNPKQASFIFVVLPEHTPIIEAYRASQDLRTIGILPAGVIANQVLDTDVGTNKFFTDRLETQKQRLAEIDKLFSVPLITMPLLAEEPQGVEQLRKAPITFFLNLG
jgi:arsenite-transporting ATPase